MEMIAFVKNEERALDFAKEILEKDLKKDINDFEIKITKMQQHKFLIKIFKK